MLYIPEDEFLPVDRYPERACGLIYFIQQEHTWAVKIGFSSDMETLVSRMQVLRTGSPYPLTLVHLWEGDPARERALHRRFAAYRLRGEWFRPCEGMAEFIASCKAWQKRHARILAGTA